MKRQLQLFTLCGMVLAGILSCQKNYTVSPLSTLSTSAPTLTATPVCSTFSILGNNVVGAYSSQLEGYLAGTKFQLTQSGMVYSLSIYLQLGLTKFSLAIYADNGGQPGNLVVQSAAQQDNSGWNTVPVPATYLFPGNYWLVFLTSSSDTVALYENPGVSGNGVYDTYSGSGFPTAFPIAGAGYNYSGWDLYANYCPMTLATATPPTSTFTPVPTSTPTSTPTFVCSGASGTFGNTTPGSALYSTANPLWITPFTLSSNGRVTSLVLSECTSGGSPCTMVGAVYSDSGGAPNTLIGQAVTAVVSNTTCAAFNTTLTYPGNGIALPAENYWLAEEGFCPGGTWPNLGATYDTSIINLTTSATLPLPSPFPLAAAQNYDLAIYANWVCP